MQTSVDHQGQLLYLGVELLEVVSLQGGRGVSFILFPLGLGEGLYFLALRVEHRLSERGYLNSLAGALTGCRADFLIGRET